MTEPTVLAAIVAYEPTSSIEALCSALVNEGVRVVVVDNASTNKATWAPDVEATGAEVLSLPENLGMSGALAMAHEKALEFDWLLTFDQDSVTSPGIVSKLLSSASGHDDIAMVGSVVVDDLDGAPLQCPPPPGQPVRLLITSGTLTRVAALSAVGGFRRDLFIDHVDHDICLRLRAAGWRLAIQPDCVMRHRIGGTRAHRLPGGWSVRTTHHNATRQYYRYRNYVLLVRSGTTRADRGWSRHTGLALLIGILKIAALEDDRPAKLRAVWRGVGDGLRGRAGPLRQHRPGPG